MIFEVYPAGVYQANCYIIGDEVSKIGAVVDPGGDPEGILDVCKRHQLTIKYIILTHGHLDHAAGAADIKKAANAKIYMNKKDEYLIKGKGAEITPILRNTKTFDVDEYISEGDLIAIGNIKVRVVETPGHSPGGISLLMDGIALTGDALFKGSVGRCDFEFGSMESLIKAVKEKILTLPDDTKVYPGHGPSTTVGAEKKFNPYLK
jgi:hydroxyacylglutathione hydrolase